ncbi:MAG: UDP-N-acetylmuramate--L-alanine ligase [Planctomycetota bacterium]
MSFASDRFHLVGVGGAGMSGLARLLGGAGKQVSGSDTTGGEALAALGQLGIEAWVGCQPERIVGTDGYVIRSAAVPTSDAEVQECVRRGFTSLLYAEAVGRLSEGRRTLAVGGTHGKTTTTALTVAALRAAGFDPSHLIGGEVPQFGANGHGGTSPEFVVEACEFNRSFHHLRPFGAAILNVDPDHFDCYPSSEDLALAFAGYLARIRPDGVALVEESVPRSVISDLRGDVRVLTVGSGLWTDIRAVDVRERGGCWSFAPMLCGERLPRIELSLSGRHNMHNALFALGLAHVAGADPARAGQGIAAFAGVRRRFEVHHGARGGVLINDYAHHPAEIRVVLETARRRFPGRRLVVAFQPHQHQRTLVLLPQFAEALARADEAIIADIYGARESDEIKAKVSAGDLVEAILRRGGQSSGGGSVGDLPDRIAARARPDDLVLMLGAGDIDRAMEAILASL